MAKLRALINMNHGRMMKPGDIFTETSKDNIKYFETHKFAEVVKEEQPKEIEKEVAVKEITEDAQDFEDDDFDDAEPFDEAAIDKATTHAQLDDIQKELGFDLPGRDKLNLDQRKAKIKAELSGDAK